MGHEVEECGQSQLGQGQVSSNHLSMQIADLFERAGESEVMRWGCTGRKKREK